MEYNLRAHSPDTITPVHRFTGDDLIDSRIYELCMSGGYMSTLSFIIGGAKALDLDVDSETLERWKRICNAAYLIDDFIDNADDTRRACDLYDTSMGQIFAATNSEILSTETTPFETSPLLLPAIVLMKNSITPLPADNVSNLQNSALGISAVARRKIECLDVSSYLNLLREEAYYTSQLITESASSDMQTQPAYSDFKIWCQQLMHMAILGDSAIDLRDDANHDVTNVTPTMRNIAKIAIRAVAAGCTIIQKKPQRRATVSSLVERSKFYRT